MPTEPPFALRARLSGNKCLSTSPFSLSISLPGSIKKGEGA